MPFSTGVEAKAYRNTGVFGTPVWDEMTHVQDVTQNQGGGEAEIKVRGKPFAQYKRGIVAASISLAMAHETFITQSARTRQWQFSGVSQSPAPRFTHAPASEREHDRGRKPRIPWKLR